MVRSSAPQRRGTRGNKTVGVLLARNRKKYDRHYHGATKLWSHDFFFFSEANGRHYTASLPNYCSIFEVSVLITGSLSPPITSRISGRCDAFHDAFVPMPGWAITIAEIEINRGLTGTVIKCSGGLACVTEVCVIRFSSNAPPDDQRRLASDS